MLWRRDRGRAGLERRPRAGLERGRASPPRAVERVSDAGSGVALADWAALAREPEMVSSFEHLVVLDPPPFPHLERLVASGPGFLHLAWGEAEVALAERVHDEEWPHRGALVSLYRTLRAAPDRRLTLRASLEGSGRLPQSPEVAGRRLRCLEALGAIQWDESSTARVVRVVSSEQKDLERLSCFVAYRMRSEEGKRFLSERRQPR